MQQPVLCGILIQEVHTNCKRISHHTCHHLLCPVESALAGRGCRWRPASKPSILTYTSLTFCCCRAKSTHGWEQRQARILSRCAHIFQKFTIGCFKCPCFLKLTCTVNDQTEKHQVCSYVVFPQQQRFARLYNGRDIVSSSLRGRSPPHRMLPVIRFLCSHGAPCAALT